MCVYIYKYIYIYTIHAYIYMYVYTYIHIHIYTICAYTPTLVCLFVLKFLSSKRYSQVVISNI